MTFATRCGTLATALGLSALMALSANAQDKHKVYLSMSYIGNDWQAEASNMVKAMAASADMKDKIDLEVQVAGPNASARSSRSTPWSRRAPRRSSSIRSRRRR